MAESITQLLKARGCEVKVVSSAQKGLDQLDYFAPDAVILDTQLGQHNGVEFVYEMRSHADMDAVPVYIYSTNRNILDARFQSSWKLAKADVFYKPTTTPKQLVMHVLRGR